MASLSEILSPFGGARLVEWFTDLTELWHDTTPIKPNDTVSPHGLTQWLHYKNYVIWHLEETVRKKDIAENHILENERRIDAHNLKRLQAIEQMDIWIDNVLTSAGIVPDDNSELNSETPGSIIDRLSILTLKIFHMQTHLEDDDITPEHKNILRVRLSVLEEQRHDVAKALDKLMLDLRQAKKKHKVYRQFKIYNDPSFSHEQYAK